MNDYHGKVKDQDGEFEDFLIERLVEITDHNTENNNHKSDLLTKSSQWMAFSFLGGAIAVILYFLNVSVKSNLNTVTNENEQHKHQPAADTTANAAPITAHDTTKRTDITAAPSAVPGRTQRQDTLHPKVK